MKPDKKKNLCEVNTVGWTQDDMQDHVFACHDEIRLLYKIIEQPDREYGGNDAAAEGNIMETKHTPGPWMATLANMITTENARTELATVWGNPSRYHVPEAEAKANAKLIAAAPELLGALKQCLVIISHTGGMHDTVDRSQKAIAKATE